MFSLILPLLAVFAITFVRAQRVQNPVPGGGMDWALLHMESEHHVDNFDPGAFFTLHDFDSDGAWTADEVRRMYGLSDPTTKDVPEEDKAKAVMEVFKIFDRDSNSRITREEFITKCRQGAKLPDFGFGPGHHGDDEYEYEIHHYEQYHDENTAEEDLIHPEDIEHFRKHDEDARQEQRIERLDSMSIVMENVPSKFKRHE